MVKEEHVRDGKRGRDGMGSIGIWQDGIGQDLACMLAAAGLAVATGPAGSALGDEVVCLVAAGAALAAHAGVVAGRRVRCGARPFSVLAVLPATADETAVASALALADEVIFEPVRAVELTGRVTRLLAAREQALAQALHRESLGRLAAGIAHEINTPVQYVGGNLEFLGTALGKLLELLDALAETALTDRDEGSLAEELTQLLDDEELGFLLQEVPAAIRESKEGLDQVTSLVLAMKRFAQPGIGRPEPLDLAQAVADTLAVSRSVWHFAADVTVDMDANLPPVLFVPGDLNQVLLHIVVNAAEAIAEKYAGQGEKGHITIRATRNGAVVELVIADDGPGIPEAIRQRIFDPFFTTKAAGKGSGQGLAISQAILVRHNARLEVLTAPDAGTSIVISLPVAQQPVLDC
ncbi:hypothetical protein GTA51_08000 [Desulfovibrio aerotolerans]|uniref:histidine kinase n=2 Tax=Solidesulfovibrio aerotolerans TaxID=295255 RepID=A0A7C9N0B1_9BACT|nr:hypothetical protein [Solidesulfovibrio aerotolerans]